MNGTLVRGILGALPVALLALGAQAASAQETISTDRPGLGFGTSTVPAGAFQVELGLPAVGLSSNGEADARLINFPGLLRVGITESLELRLGSTLFNASTLEVGGVEQTTDGFGAVEMGAKLGFSAGEGGPALALIPSVIVPVDEDFSGNRAAYTLNGVAAWSLPAGFGLTTVAGLAINPDGEDDYATSHTLVGVLGRSLAERLGGFVEAGLYPTPDAADPAYVGGGLTYLLTDLVQLDAFADVGVSSDAASDLLFGVGASVRF
jgi:hypothetical protein